MSALPDVPVLERLAVDIRTEHDAAERDARSAVAHAIRAGELLAEAKEQVAHGEWLPWLDGNFEFTERTAQNYMRLSTNAQHVSHLPSVRDALAELAETRVIPVAEATLQTLAEDPTATVDLTDDQVAAIRALHPAPATPGHMAVHYSSQTDEWATPQDLFDTLNAEFSFTLDVCALETSAKCGHYFTPEMDGLAQNWTGTCWMNPPYGDVIGQWVKKAHDSALDGATVVCLVPARVDTGWWWDYCRYGEVRFLKGRLRFGESASGAPFPSALVVFGRPADVVWWEWR